MKSPRLFFILTVMLLAAGLWGPGTVRDAAAAGKPSGYEEPVGKAPEAPCRLGYRPQMVRAEPLRLYRGGPYIAVLFGNVVAAGRVQYLYVLEVSKADYPCLYVASEVNSLGPPGKGPYFLGVFSGDGHSNYGLSEDWGDIELFEARSAEIVRQYLGVGLEREPNPPWERR